MRYIGVDFGSSGVRMAASEDAVHVSSARLRAVRWEPGRADGAAGCWRIESLKSLLNFNSVFPGTPPRRTLALAAELLQAARGVSGGADPARCVLAVPAGATERERAVHLATARYGGFPQARLVEDTRAALLASEPAVAEADRVLVCSWGAGRLSAAYYRRTGTALQPVAQEFSRELGGDTLDGAVLRALLSVVGAPTPAGETFPGDDIACLAERSRRSLELGEDVIVPRAALAGLRQEMDGSPAWIAVSASEWRTLTAGFRDEAAALIQRMMVADGPPDVVLAVGGMWQTPSLQDVLPDRDDTRFEFLSASVVARGALLFGRGVGEAEWERAAEAPPPLELDEPVVARRSGKWSDLLRANLDQAQQHYDTGRLYESVEQLDHTFQELSRFSIPIYRRASDALQSDGRHADAAAVLALACHRAPGDAALAVAFAEAGLRLARSRSDGAAGSDALRVLQQCAGLLQPWAEREPAYRTHLARVLHAGGCLLHQQGRTAEALTAVAESARLAPTHPQYAQDLATLQRSQKPRPPAYTHPTSREPGRNQPCPCGSGAKYKVCCMQRKA